MADNKYNILKAASWYTVGNILIKSVAFVVLPIFTHLMNTHEFGIYSVYTSYLMVFETIILMGLSSTIALARYAKEVEFGSYISTILVIPLMIASFCMLITNMVIPFYGNILSMNSTLWNCLFVSAGTGSVCNIIGAKLVIEGRYKLYLSYSALNTIGNAVISLLLCYTVYLNHDIYLARVFGNVSTAVLCAMFLLYATKTKIQFVTYNVKYAFAWGIPLLLHTVATVVLTQSDRILIRYIDSYSSAGIYAVATTMIAIPSVLLQSLHQAWTPWFYDKLNSKNYKQINWLNNRYLIFFATIIGIFMLIIPDIIHLITEESYWSCIYSLVPLCVSVFAELLYAIPTSLEYYYKKTTYIMTATLITVVLNIILDIFFIYYWGYHGAAYATVLSKIILFFMHLSFSKKIDPNDVIGSNIVIGLLIVLALLSFVITMTIDLFWVRFALLIVLIMYMGTNMLKNKNLIIEKLRVC